MHVEFFDARLPRLAFDQEKQTHVALRSLEHGVADQNG